jgi:hypothetical protein
MTMGNNVITETITWHLVSEGDLPDADTTVQIELDPASDYSEPVFLGFWDGNDWRDVHGSKVEVIAWADLPMGTQGRRDHDRTPTRGQ